jgi:hypothetical protein
VHGRLDLLPSNKWFSGDGMSSWLRLSWFLSLKSLLFRVLKNRDNFFSGGQGSMFHMITIFCDFSQYSAKKLAFFLNTNVMIKCFSKFSFVSCQKRQFFFAEIFGEKILKIKTSVPGTEILFSKIAHTLYLPMPHLTNGLGKLGQLAILGFVQVRLDNFDTFLSAKKLGQKIHCQTSSQSMTVSGPGHRPLRFVL